MAEAQQLAGYIRGTRPAETFYTEFGGRYSPGFDVRKDLTRIGVVNQTTMLATDTQAIADFLKQTLMETYGEIENHFADTRDTLCYATLDNQSAINGLLAVPANLAIIVGGYNSSNTSHLVELCEEKLPTYFINSEEKILSEEAVFSVASVAPSAITLSVKDAGTPSFNLRWIVCTPISLIGCFNCTILFST